ncbi:MAG TPA: hypothetical protein VI546_03015, partial [candidate division Zixibacteria bacterium]|nr:hypothetical protein [candidate division Zixibacteria bacterium]
MSNLKLIYPALLLLLALSLGCGTNDAAVKPRLVMFAGVDISGSFMKTREEDFDDAMEFLSHYLYAHLNGLGGLERPSVLFVSSIGGAKPNEPKTFFPIQTFEGKTVDEIHDKLTEIFPKEKPNDFTDYNAFFEQVALTVKNKNLVLRPISVVMVSDGIPDAKSKGKTDFRSLELKPLERLARNITVRLLYTDAVVGKNWQTKVKRSRVKIWTQDAEVMASWKDPKILLPEKPLEEQAKFFGWVQDNVDFGVRARRVD